MTFTIFRDPAPILVRYLKQRFKSHDSSSLPEGLRTTDYAPLGTTFPRLQIGFDESDQVSEGNSAFASTLTLTYEPQQRAREDDDTIADYERIPDDLLAIHILALEFLEDTEALRSTGVTILKQGLTGTRADDGDPRTVSFVITLSIQSFWQRADD